MLRKWMPLLWVIMQLLAFISFSIQVNVKEALKVACSPILTMVPFIIVIGIASLSSIPALVMTMCVRSDAW